jgi:hypothetical protein
MRKLFALMFCLTACDASAQTPDAVNVTGNSLVGDWKVGWPTFGAVNMFGSIKWGPLQGNFCRIEQTQNGLTANCFPNPGRDGTVSVEGNHFHMSWGSMLVRVYVDGSMSSAEAFDGHFGVKLTGLAIENPNVSHGEKIVLSATASDDGGKAETLKSLLNSIESNQSGTNIDTKSSMVHMPNGNSLRTSGAIEAVIYVGALPKPLPPDSKELPQPEFYRVYDVEFTNGHRICGLHQRDDDVVDAFSCI